MKCERFDLGGEGKVYLDTYVLDKSPEMPGLHVRPAVMICPGGAYIFCSDREAEPVAMAFAAEGFHTFVLRYSLNEDAVFPNSLCDLSRAMKIVRDHSEEWGVNVNAIAVAGFSAGGHLAATLGTLWNDKEIQTLSGCLNGENRPDALVLCYPATGPIGECPADCLNALLRGSEGEAREKLIEKISPYKQVGKQTPPSFIVHTYEDQTVPVENSLVFAKALSDNGIPFELHITQKGVHGLGLGNDVTYAVDGHVEPSFQPWVKNCSRWLKDNFNKK